jgi:hypothetical protein
MYVVMAALVVPAAAMAKTDGLIAPGKKVVHLVPPLQLADVVVTNPNQTPTPTPAPAAPSAVAVPVQPATPAPAVVEAPEHQSKSTYVEQHSNRSYMGTIAVSALMGALAGALVGGSLYFLADDQHHPQRIGYWAAGGVLVGTTVGIVEVAVEESRADRAVTLHLPSDPAPTLRLALYQARF